jgi:hypothetical protein
LSPDLESAFETIRATARDWNGRDPVRRFWIHFLRSGEDST